MDTISRLFFLLFFGAFVVFSPSEPQLSMRAVVERYSVAGSQLSNTTATDPFDWKLYVLLLSQFQTRIPNLTLMKLLYLHATECGFLFRQYLVEIVVGARQQ